MEQRIDLDAANAVIEEWRPQWAAMGITASETTWRDQSRGWPPPLLTRRAEAGDPDSVGVSLVKGAQEGSVVLFKGGWADLLFWNGADDDVITEAPGYDDWLDLEAFARVLDRLTTAFS